ncbi:MAG: peptidyl-prolyl cis-trans isomerase [Pelovirga sp.]
MCSAHVCDRLFFSSSLRSLGILRRSIRYCLWFLLLLAALPACRERDSGRNLAAGQEPVAPLLEVGERRLTLQQFEAEVALRYPAIAALPEQEGIALKVQLLNQLLERELLLAEAERLEVALSAAEIEAAMVEMRGEYDAAEFEQVLLRSGQSFESWRDSLRLQLLTDKVIAATVGRQIDITEQEMEAYYHAHREAFRRPLEVRVRQMLFRTHEEALVVKKLLQDGADFATLAQQHSVSPDSAEGGFLGYVSAGYLPPEFDAVIFRLPLRQVSEPVETSYGYHLFQVDRRRKAGLRPYAAVREEIAGRLYQEREEAVYREWLMQLRERSQVRVDWSMIDPALSR